MRRWVTGLLFALTLGGAQEVTPELMSRMLGADATVYLGELPPELPIALAVPEGVTVDAAVVRSWLGQTTVQAFLSSSLPVGETWPALSDSLEAAGLLAFTPPAGAYGWGWWGFVVDGPVIPSEPQLFCGPDAYAELFAAADETPLEFTLTLNTRGRVPGVITPCDAEAHEYHSPRDVPPVPALTPPEGVALLHVETGGSFLEQTSSALFEPGPTLEALHDHYGAQLAAAGWAELRRGGDELLSYSQWRKEDGGTLLMTFMDEALGSGFVAGTVQVSQR
jgi:hypothetical protein